MGSLYPADRDTFRRFASDIDDMIADDINAMFDALATIEVELGINPSGDMGTISARLFENVEPEKGYWGPLEWKVHHNQTGYVSTYGGGSTQVTRYEFAWDPHRFRRLDLEFGAGIPAVFSAPQPSVYWTATSPPGQSPYLTGNSSLREDRVTLWSRDTRGLPTLATAPPSSIGVLVWGLKC